ncbi:hypothetical protein FA95DRAFT_1600710 [Auriscalpium vulgare]|uniref:Uncharacterized protein n=1 Tax=Auriscalpium vulgare TaxID=40419 RepID=A0ACB8SBN1_9AGAM|nr:hypothetical protein FA95DRAFT_1600710 [Auriscalpium vulgare]
MATPSPALSRHGSSQPVSPAASTLSQSTSVHITGEYNGTYSPTSTLSSLTDRSSRAQGFGGTGTAGSKRIIRADPALVSCFDPADKELYDLWVSKA